MSGDKDEKQASTKGREIRAYVLRKLKEALPKIRDSDQPRKKGDASGRGIGD